MATTLRLAMIPDGPRTQSLPGNSWPTQYQLSNSDRGAIAFKNGVDGKFYYKINVPSNIAVTPNLGIVVRAWTTVNAGNVVLNVAGGQYAAGASVDPSLTASGAATVTVPGTAKQAFDTTFTTSLPAPVADDTYIVELFRNGANAADTLAALLYVEFVMFRCDF